VGSWIVTYRGHKPLNTYRLGCTSKDVKVMLSSEYVVFWPINMGGLRDKILVAFALANVFGMRTDANHVLYLMVISHNIAM
jgi:hypothetical protein